MCARFNVRTIIGLLGIILVCIADFLPLIVAHNGLNSIQATYYFDDSSNIFFQQDKGALFSTDDGVTVTAVPEFEGKEVLSFLLDPYRLARAFALIEGPALFLTDDTGLSWTKVDLPGAEKFSSYPILDFNAQDSEMVLASFYECDLSSLIKGCKNVVYYTDTGFKKPAKALPIEAQKCIFATSSSAFDEKFVKSIVCSVNELNSFGHIVKSKIISSEDAFKSHVELALGDSASGSIIDVRVVQNFIVATVRADKFKEKSFVTVFTSKDAVSFRATDVHVDISYGLLGFLESSPLALILYTMSFGSWSHPMLMSTLFRSDSSGQKFSVMHDKVFGVATKIKNIDGAWIIASSDDDDTSEEAPDKMGEPRRPPSNLKSWFTFNDGLDWNLLAVNDDNGCKVSNGCSFHPALLEESDGSGSSGTGSTPGIVVAAGSKGQYLTTDDAELKMWVSRDSGASWNFAIDEQCTFSIGDLGNVILAVPSLMKDVKIADKYYFSLDQGLTWTQEQLEIPVLLTGLNTMADGTSSKFVLDGTDKDNKSVVYTFDFSAAHGGKTCGDSDMEKTYVRVAPGGDPICVYGQQEWFDRRKQSADCFVNKLYRDLEVHTEPCECTAQDFECASQFKSDNGSCLPDAVYFINNCKSKTQTFTLPEKQKILNNGCKGDPKKFIPNVTIKCSNFLGDDGGSVDEPDRSSLITTSEHHLDAGLEQYAYIPREDIVGGENIIILQHNKKMLLSENGGTSFVKFPRPDDIEAYFVGPNKGQVIFVTAHKHLFVSGDSGNTFHRRKVPSDPASASRRVISFHNSDPEQFIWYGQRGNDKVIAYHTSDGGRNFQQLATDVVYCDFVGSSLEESYLPNPNMIFCAIKDGHKQKLVSSTDLFANSQTVYENIVGYAITTKFVVVAVVASDSRSLEAKVTVDGETFAAAKFPADFTVDVQQAYTVLDSLSGSVFMHVTQESKPGFEYGSILKLNSNGTSYILALEAVNRDGRGYVDYDRIEGLEGVIIANTVNNVGKRSKKALKTRITHNDGAVWDYLQAPAVDSTGKKIGCNPKSPEKCSLNLHGYTEREDIRDTFSSSAATGLLIGVGNVGETLGDYKDASTFMSNDGGITWREIAKGAHMWEYGDRGTVLVLIKTTESTNSLLYSLDDGFTWNLFKFTDNAVTVVDLATAVDDDSRQFLIFAKLDKESAASRTIEVDFTRVYQRQCQLDLDNPDQDDYVFWSPSHPNLPDNCLFGHELEYLRRTSGRSCFIGSAPLAEGFKVTKNCSCTRRDFECDYNYYRDIDNTCKLVKGLNPADHQREMCSEVGQFQFFEPTGYRKLSQSTCTGGKEFDSWNPKACPGKEKEFNAYYGQDVTLGKLFFLIFIPLVVFISAVWFVYDRGIRRNGGFQRLGQIRLDDGDGFDPIENNGVDKAVNNIVKGGVVAAAALFSAFKFLRRTDRMLLDKAMRFILRLPTGRRSYVRVPDEEGQGLFDDLDQDLDDGPTEIQAPYNDFVDSEPETTGEPNNADEPDERLFEINGSDEESQQNQ